jgi:hypothetical protein
MMELGLTLSGMGAAAASGLAEGASGPGRTALPALALPADFVAAPAEPKAYSLRVSGGKPLRLSAVCLAEGNSWCLGTPAWHEVQVLRGTDGDHAVGIKCFRKAPGEADTFHAEVFPNIEEAVAFLEGFDPTTDLRVDIDASDRSVSAAEIALKAAALRQRADEVVRQWRALVGEMLFRLDLAD